MKLYFNKYNANIGISFKQNIIDSHAHVGCLNGQTYTKDNLDVFIKSELPNKDKVTKFLVSDIDVLTGKKGEYDGNKLVLELFKNNKSYSILASCSPKDGNIQQIEKLFKENSNQLVGLKFHSAIQNLALSDEKYKPYLEFATKKNLPCLFHSEVELLEKGILNPKLKHIADPELIYALSQKYPKTPVIMAHLGSGWNEAHDKAIDVLIKSIKNGDANLYADISWVDIDNAQTHVVKAIKKLKGIGEKDWIYGDQSYRLMFGTDAPLSRFSEKNAVQIYSNYVDAIKNAIRNDADLKANSEEIIDNLFYKNAEQLFMKNKTSTSVSKSTTDSKWKYIVIGAMILTAICGTYFYNKSKQNEITEKL